MYIERLFVHQEYRENGIASFVLRNLPKLIRGKYGYNVRYACAYQRPDVQNLMPMEKMEIIMNRTMEKAGYVRIPTKDDAIIYAKKYQNTSEF